MVEHMPSPMQVTFARTGTRRYAVRVTRPDFPTVEMDPAPGFDDHLPHDLVHYVVEEELGLRMGVFGQLAAGGDAGTFSVRIAKPARREWSRQQRRNKRRGVRLASEGRADAELSERAAAICLSAWLGRSSNPLRRAQAREMASYVRRLRDEWPRQELALLSPERLDHICARLSEVSEQWRRLGVGEALNLSWRG